MRILKPTLAKLGNSGADALIPSHGEIIYNPKQATDLTIERLDEAWRNYSSISSLRYYFPKMMAKGEDDPSRMVPAPTHPEIPFLQRKGTTFILKSESGAAFIIDCGYDRMVDDLRTMLRSKEINSICFI